MNRRENLKLLFAGSIGAGLLLGCEPEQVKLQGEVIGTPGGRTEEEKARDAKLLAEKFFTEKELKKIPEIVRVNYTTGNYSMFAEIVCTDIQQLKVVLHDKLQNIKGIERTETLISLEESFNRNIVVV